MATFAEATAVKIIDTHTYSVFFHDAWAVGNVPHGGIVASNILAAVKLHFDTVLRYYRQPHTITLHLEYLRRTCIGSAIITIQNTKLGRRTSTIHITLIQDNGKDKSATPTTCVVGYITQSNMITESGISLPTHWTLSPSHLPFNSAAATRNDEDPNWALQRRRPYPKFRKVGQHINTYLPRKKLAEKAIADEWISLSKDGQNFTQESLGFVADLFPQIVENCYTAGEVETGLAGGEAQSQGSGDQRSLAEMSEAEKSGVAKFWYPTLLLNLDVKKALPAEGVKFLFVRARAKQIRNGRMDLEVTILDEGGELVALSNHVVLVMDSARNLKRSGGKEGSKL